MNIATSILIMWQAKNSQIVYYKIVWLVYVYFMVLN